MKSVVVSTALPLYLGTEEGQDVYSSGECHA